jgi:hypothetical protein
MKTLKYIFLILFVCTINNSVFSQDITFIPQDTLLQGNIGEEMIFYVDVTNISAVRQIVFIVRTINNLPSDWYSSLCFDVCFPSTIDSIATTPDFNSSPLDPGESRELSLHVTAVNQDSIAHVQLQAGTFDHPDDRIIENFTATTIPVSVDDENNINISYYIAQNYPNPFNPATKISYKIGEPGFVHLKVYNVLGVEVGTLVNEYENSGEYSIDFDASSLSSGVYFYTLSVNNFTQTRKMILEK